MYQYFLHDSSYPPSSEVSSRYRHMYKGRGGEEGMILSPSSEVSSRYRHICTRGGEDLSCTRIWRRA